MALYEMEDAKERVILVGVQENDAEPEEESLDELAELARTAGAAEVHTRYQGKSRDGGTLYDF